MQNLLVSVVRGKCYLIIQSPNRHRHQGTILPFYNKKCQQANATAIPNDCLSSVKHLLGEANNAFESSMSNDLADACCTGEKLRYQQYYDKRLIFSTGFIGLSIVFQERVQTVEMSIARRQSETLESRLRQMGRSRLRISHNIS